MRTSQRNLHHQLLRSRVLITRSSHPGTPVRDWHGRRLLRARRFGVTNGYWLFYGKAGGGWVGNDDFTINNLTTGTSITASNNNTNSGWLVGAGIEWAFAPNWSAKVEYNYLGLDDRTFIVPAGVPGFLPGDTFTQSNRNIQMVKVGVNYLFNWSSYRY